MIAVCDKQLQFQSRDGILFLTIENKKVPEAADKVCRSFEKKAPAAYRCGSG